MPAALTVRDLMQPDPIAVPPDAPIADVMRVMNERRIGAVLVTRDGGLVGIFTERDLLKRVTLAVPGWRDYPVSDWMTPDPHVVSPELGWDDAVGRMTKLRVRHLPVLRNGELVGLITSRGLMARRTEFLDAEVAAQTKALRQANEQLLARDSEAVHNLRAAGRLQTRMLLPRSAPPCPGLDWAVHYAPLDHLGGDYYDYATPTPDHVGFLIADASGHSLPAAIVAVMTHIAYRETANDSVNPGAVLTSMNARLQGLTDERFVTAFCGVLHVPTRTLSFAAAGHPYPFLARGGKVTPLSNNGFLLGIIPDEVYGEKRVTLEPGDRVCFYTDGLSEARNEIGEMYGTDRLTECLSTHGSLATKDMLKEVLSSQKTFCGGTKLTDDLTVAVLAVGTDL